MPKNKSDNLKNNAKESDTTGPKVYDLEVEPQTVDAAKSKSKDTQTKDKRIFTKKKKIILGSIAVITALIIIPAVFTAIQAAKIKSTAQTTMSQGMQAVDALKAQDLIKANQHLDESYNSAKSIQNQYQSLAFLNYTPARWHYQDGQHAINAVSAGIEAAQTTVAAIEPYADVIGFAGAGSFTGGTIENRIVKILETLEVVSPALDEVSQKISYINSEIDYIDPARYPFNVNGRQVEDMIIEAKDKLDSAESTITKVKPLIKVLPQVAGVGEPQKYMVMFQNDGEIRATGGFMTAFAIIKVENGMVIPEKSDDIYELDDKFTDNLKPPDIYKDLLLVKRWNLRDMNVSPDYKSSISTFQDYYNQLPGESEVDGIIAIDTQVLSRLVEVLGPLEVPGYGVFSAEIDPRCNCPEIIYEIEDIATRPTPYFRSDRKAILGPMMGAMLQKAFDAEQDIWPPLFTQFWNLIQEKHIQFFFNDEALQTAVELNHMAGRIEETGTDYLHVNDTNLGGAKSYMFIDQEVEQDITVENGSVTKTVTITYKNPQKGDNCNLEAGKLCLNGRMPLWIRVYVPQGSTLVESLGFDEGSVNTSEDLGKTVFEGVLVVDPESSKKVSLTYQVAYQPEAEYQLFIQKQGGTKTPQYTVRVNDQRQEFQLDSDTEVAFPL